MNEPLSSRDLAFRTLVFGVAGIALAYASAFLPMPFAAAGHWLMALMVPLTLFATMALGAVRAGGALGRLRWPFLFVFGLVTGGFLIALWLPMESPTTPLLLGLPPRAAVILYGVGLLPLFMLPIVYVLTFDTLTLTDDDIARVRAARRVDSAAPGPHA